jgi:hypothetical protein
MARQGTGTIKGTSKHINLARHHHYMRSAENKVQSIEFFNTIDQEQTSSPADLQPIL